MSETVQLRYINERLQIGLVSVKEAYDLSRVNRPLTAEVSRGNLSTEQWAQKRESATKKSKKSRQNLPKF